MKLKFVKTVWSVFPRSTHLQPTCQPKMKFWREDGDNFAIDWTSGNPVIWSHCGLPRGGPYTTECVIYPEITIVFLHRPLWELCRIIYERPYIWTAKKNTNLWLIIAVIYTTKQLWNKSPKKIHAWTRLERLWPLRYRCSALPTELSNHLGAGHFVSLVIYPRRWWRMQMNIWKIVYLNCGERYEYIIDHRRLYTQLKQ